MITDEAKIRRAASLKTPMFTARVSTMMRSARLPGLSEPTC